jgi:hypothetical protein
VGTTGAASKRVPGLPVEYCCKVRHRLRVVGQLSISYRPLGKIEGFDIHWIPNRTILTAMPHYGVFRLFRQYQCPCRYHAHETCSGPPQQPSPEGLIPASGRIPIVLFPRTAPSACCCQGRYRHLPHRSPLPDMSYCPYG